MPWLWFPSSDVSIHGEALCMVVFKDADAPAAVTTDTARGVPGSTDGHANCTADADAASTAAGCPLTITCVPPRSILPPDGSDNELSVAANQNPLTEASAPGLQARPTWSNVGSPDETWIGTAAADEAPAALAAVKVT